MPTTTARDLIRQVVAAGDTERAAGVARFFKSGPGEYAEGDRFLGLTVSRIRSFAREKRDLPLAELEKLLLSEWHEVRLLALVILTQRFQRGSAADRRQIFDLYFRQVEHINNWDL